MHSYFIFLVENLKNEKIKSIKFTYIFPFLDFEFGDMFDGNL